MPEGSQRTAALRDFTAHRQRLELRLLGVARFSTPPSAAPAAPARERDDDLSGQCCCGVTLREFNTLIESKASKVWQAFDTMVIQA